MTLSPPKRVAVIGAGCSGITAIKCCLDEGLDPVCFERTDDIGGLWRYTDQPVDGQSCVMKSTVINTSKEIMTYSDFPIPAENPNYMHNTQVLQYFQNYVDHFNLKKYIQFNTSIVSVEKTEDFPISGQWYVKVLDKTSGQERTEVFDGVLACTGHHAEKHIPTFPGLSEFKGKVLHSHDYRDPDQYKDKRVVVVGIGNSGGDAAVELSRLCKQVYLSTRSGAWLLKRLGPGGRPGDFDGLNRPAWFFASIFPKLFNVLIRKQISKVLDHDLYSLTPKHGPFEIHPTVNDDMPNRILCGAIKIKSDIKRFTSTGLEFVDGTSEDDIDVVLLATGYSFGFPYISKEVINVEDNHVQLYKYMFPPDLERPTLAVIGCIQPIGAIMPISEMNCRVAARVFKGVDFLPPKAQMWEDIRSKEAAMSKRYAKSRRHTIQVDYIQHMDELAQIINCKPHFYDLFRHDPSLAVKVTFGPVTPYQYRLYGPGKWSGARDAIMTQESRVSGPLKTRPVPSGQDGQRQLMFNIGMIVFLLAIFLKLFGLL